MLASDNIRYYIKYLLPHILQLHNIFYQVRMQFRLLYVLLYLQVKLIIDFLSFFLPLNHYETNSKQHHFLNLKIQILVAFLLEFDFYFHTPNHLHFSKNNNKIYYIYQTNHIFLIYFLCFLLYQL